jgi:amino acid adenylation domain-containing protein
VAESLLMEELPIVRRLLDLPRAWTDRTVLRSAAGRLNFGELREGMLRIAAWLATEAGVRSGDRVAICLPKSLEAVQTICGILAAGAVYVPLQFRGPPARLAAILGSVEPRLLLTTGEMSVRLHALDRFAGAPPVRTVDVKADGRGLESLLSAIAPATSIPSVAPSDLGAIFFTSGSTGAPKGVMLSHGSMATTLGLGRQTRQERPDDRLISLAALHYVASLELFLPIVRGSSMLLLSEDECMFPERIASAIEKERVTQLQVTATGLRLLFERGALERRDLGSLRRVNFFGEPLPLPLLRRIMAILPRTEFVNIYGATEASAMVAYKVPRPLPDEIHALPLGKPRPLYEVTLRDDTGAEVPRGEVGEICVTGPQVMSGYWNDPELTAARRVDVRTESYRTGDLGVMDDAGLLRLVGRKDQMIKLRGHRLDLGEIEAALRAHAAVRDAVALTVPAAQGDMQIRAFVLADASERLAIDLGRLCRERLPRFAQPAGIEVLGQFPLLSTGKVDRQALKAFAAAEAL